ncbi:hypothetical protein LA080_015172 [Diaporthe eres]|nr:hypothetical protein LA080_015172 [Diaporthe eres]
MSQQRVARRSASHGALSSSYAAQGRAGSDSGHQLPPFKPLRSIREHTFLDPAASAEGMLRKTTETGNIGIFSINVTRTRDQLNGRPSGLRARASLNDLRQPSRPWSRSSDRLPGRDDRKQLPSYRDSTSEIISMYGSENHSSKSLSSSLTTPLDEYGPRSYSMTSCGPRGYFMQRHNGGQHLQDYQGRIQRPRSPYPYPTRLPRHGIRPASPALTESGDVDYSRMVEIDRISYPVFAHLDHGIGVRYRVIFMNGVGGYGQASSQARGIATVQKKPLFYDYSEDFEDIIEPQPIVPIAPIPRRVSTAFRPVVFQNNSGEGPESMEDVQNEFEAYLQEGANASHHREGGTNSIDASIQPISMPPGGAYVTSQQPADDHLDSHPSTEMAAPAGDCRDLTPVLDESVLAENTSTEKDMGQAKESTVVEITSDASTLDDPSEPKTPAFTAGVPFHEVMGPKEDFDPCRDSHEGRITVQNFRLSQGHETLPVLSKSTPASFPTPHQTDDVVSTLPRMSCHPRHDSRFYSLGSGLSDLASFVQQVDQHFQTPGPEVPEIVCSESQGSHPRTQTNQAAATVKDSPCPGDDNEPGPEKVTNAVSHPPRVSSLRENRRKATALRVNTAVDGPHQYQVVSTRDGPTLTPQPISPARILRVKNSIPQLMKALPPLPGYAPAPESPFGPAVVPMEFEPFEISQLTDARSTLIDAFQAEEAPKGYDAFIFDRKAHKPRLKLKHAASFAVEHERSSRPADDFDWDSNGGDGSDRVL